jgi:hypothetical protein
MVNGEWRMVNGEWVNAKVPRFIPRSLFAVRCSPKNAFSTGAESYTFDESDASDFGRDEG